MNYLETPGLRADNQFADAVSGICSGRTGRG